jgi:hypothetical protein
VDPSFLNSSPTQTLLAGGADPDHGDPSAMKAIVLFKQEEKWRAKFEAAPGKGKASMSNTLPVHDSEEI